MSIASIDGYTEQKNGNFEIVNICTLKSEPSHMGNVQYESYTYKISKIFLKLFLFVLKMSITTQFSFFF